MAKILAPWTFQQVDQLNKWQRAGYVHPFTCGNEHLCDDDVLVATVEGWRCPDPKCPYTQNWAHDFMADPEVLEKCNPQNIFNKHKDGSSK